MQTWLVSFGLPSLDQVAEVVMDALVHEGDQYLWEAVWMLNAEFPDAPMGAKVGLARSAVLGLFEKG